MKLNSRIKRSFTVGMAMALMAPVWTHGYGEASVIKNYLSRPGQVPMIKPSWGNFIIHTDTLTKLYSLRSFNAIWVDSDGRPNRMALALKSYLLTADRQGLISGDYWDADVEDLFVAAQSNQKNWITFELAASEAMIRYATHLSVGRFDPESIDSDIKYKKKDFGEYAGLIEAINAGPEKIGAGLDRFAPSHKRYADLVLALNQLRVVKNKGGWATLASPASNIKLGVTSPLIEQIRERFNQLGYVISPVGATADAEFDRVLREFQANNGLRVDGVIGTRSEVLRVLNYSVNQRIAQIEVNMEKLRWLPRVMEARHIMVNLATTEFNLFDGDKKIFDFKTINGQPFRRTPSMRDVLFRIILNPPWRIPDSIAVKDKIPALQKDLSYLQKRNMKLMDARTNTEVDPAAINLSDISIRNMPYYIRQNPGYNNALGVMKFDLRHNPWEIYLHDTDERGLFVESSRHRSSGCIRLEHPMDLAEYLVQGLPDWDRLRLMDSVPSKLETNSRESITVNLKDNAIPVYTIYLTVEKSATGGLRFVDDVYGQDLRISKALQSRKSSTEIF